MNNFSKYSPHFPSVFRESITVNHFLWNIKLCDGIQLEKETTFQNLEIE